VDHWLAWSLARPDNYESAARALGGFSGAGDARGPRSWLLPPSPSVVCGCRRLHTIARWHCWAKPSAEDDAWRARAARSIADLQAAVWTFEPALHHEPSATPTTDPDDQENQGASAGGKGQLAAQLDLVATLIDMGVPTRGYSVSLGGFDTHSDERGTQERLLAELDAALTGFHQWLSSSERGRQVVTMIYSEFGRRVLANASDGTDHGPVFLLGRGVRGGFCGAEPSLTDLADGDLKVGTDFRSIYATFLDHVLGTDPGTILDGYSKHVDKLIG
jgi:uncharacterized protein (DUF1501 family)